LFEDWAFGSAVQMSLQQLHNVELDVDPGVAFLVFDEPTFWRNMLLLMGITFCSNSRSSTVKAYSSPTGASVSAAKLKEASRALEVEEEEGDVVLLA
jgi:hypothetical protein